MSRLPLSVGVSITHSRSATRLPLSVAALTAVLLLAAACGDGKTGGPEAAPSVAPVPAAAKGDRARDLAAYDRGLDFLLSKQKDGVWSVQGHPHAGFTALAITPVLERPGGVREADPALATGYALTALAPCVE